MRQSNFYLLIFSFILLNFTLSQRSLAYNTRNIRIGIIQHFGKNNNQTLSVKAKSGQKNLQVIFPELPLTLSVDKNQVLITNNLNIKTNYISLDYRIEEKTKIIAGAYRTYENAEYWAETLKERFPEYNWQILYPDPWIVQAESDNPEETLRRLKSQNFSGSWFKDSFSQVKSLSWTGSAPIGIQAKNPQEIFQFNRRKIIIRPLNNDLIEVNGKVYAGFMEILPDSFGNYSVINELPVEEYLRGVIPFEIGADSPQAALETQAILARTYALANFKRFVPENYHLCASQHCQVYQGLSATNKIIDQAIQNTNGLILKNKYNQIAQVFYYSTDGGYSADFTDIWPARNPRSIKDLSGQPTCSNLPKKFNLSNEEDLKLFLTSPEAAKEWNCYDSVSPSFRWQKTIEKKLLTQTLEKAKKRWQFAWPDFEQVDDIEITERSSTGHVLKLLVRTDKKNFIIEKDEVRSALGGLKSSLFIIEKTDNKIILKGGGFGHSVGLSQFGARYLASTGVSYQNILKIYFPNYILGSAI